MSVAAIATTFFAASAASASAGFYDGYIKGMPATTSFDLTIEKVNGKRKVTKMNNDEVPFECEDGPAPMDAQNVPFAAPIRHRAFDALYDEPSVKIRVRGEFKGGGKVSGTLKERFEYGQPTGVCTTGKLKWVATKQ